MNGAQACGIIGASKHAKAVAFGCFLHHKVQAGMSKGSLHELR